MSYYDHVEAEKAPQLVAKIRNEGIAMALISDAGTPCVSDPGFRLVAEAHKQGVTVVPVPGASALTCLVSGSGLPSDRFMFIGFLPAKDKALKEEVENWKDFAGSVVFYESTRRLKKSLNLIKRVHPSLQIAVGRELTKLHEEVALFSIEDAVSWCEGHQTLKGEVAVMAYGFSSRAEAVADDLSDLESKLKAELLAGKRFKDLLKEYKDCGLAHQELYQLLVKLKEEKRES